MIADDAELRKEDERLAALEIAEQERRKREMDAKAREVRRSPAAHAVSPMTLHCGAMPA